MLNREATRRDFMFSGCSGLKAHGTTRGASWWPHTTFLTMAYIMFVIPRSLAMPDGQRRGVRRDLCRQRGDDAADGSYANLRWRWRGDGRTRTSLSRWCRLWAAIGGWRWAACPVGHPVRAHFVTPAREWLINAIPTSLKLAIAAGIGFFLALIGLEGAGVVVAARRRWWTAAC